MAIYMVLGCLGSASFGKHLFNRILSRVGAICMIFFLCIELWLFQFVAHPSRTCSLIGVLLSGLVLWSFLMTAFTDPGTPSSPEWQHWKKHSSIIETKVSADITKERSYNGKPKHWGSGESTECDRCNHSRPARSHHCKHCDRCVLRMDHHCPLIGNCVGWRNHKYYLLLQWWQFWGCVMFLFASGGPGELALYGTMPFSGLWMELLLYTGCSWAAVVMVIAARSFMVALYMATRNETHVEKCYIGENPYALPQSLDNLVQLLGPLDIKLLMPIGVPRKCGGTEFPHTGQEHTQERSVRYQKEPKKLIEDHVSDVSANYGSV